MFTSDFLHPARLWLLLGVAVLAIAHIAVSLMRKRATIRFTQADMLHTVAPKRPGWRRHVVAATQLLGVSAAVDRGGATRQPRDHPPRDRGAHHGAVRRVPVDAGRRRQPVPIGRGAR
ncbi:MAG: BatA domain-containing protein [Ilumatobacteraceae bacterium]